MLIGNHITIAAHHWTGEFLQKCFMPNRFDTLLIL